MILNAVMLVGAIVVILWTLIPLLRHDAWWVRVFDFPRVQITVLTAALLAAYLALSDWRTWEDRLVIAGLALCVLYQLGRIARYTPLFPKQLKSAPQQEPDATLSLLVSNVLTPNRESDLLLDLIRQRDPDIVLAVETDKWWEARLDALESEYPYSVKHPLDNLYGMHLYSRLELVDPETLFLVEDDVPSMHATVVLRNGHKADLHCLHPAPPSPTENPSSAERDAELLIVAKKLNGSDRSTIVMGDLNDVAWSATTRLFQKISGLLDPRIGRGPYSTFHAKYPFLRWPLDHVFCSADFALVSMARLPNIGSDHFPIHAVLQHTPAAEAMHDEPAATRDEEDWADEKIDKVDADKEALQGR